MLEGIIGRIYRKALSNQLAIAVGSRSSPERCSIQTLAPRIERRFGLPHLPTIDASLLPHIAKAVEANDQVAKA